MLCRGNVQALNGTETESVLPGPCSRSDGDLLSHSWHLQDWLSHVMLCRGNVQALKRNRDGICVTRALQKQ